MNQLMEDARREAGFTQAELARKMHMSLRAYQNMAYGEGITPDQAMQLSQILNAPALTMVYCRRECSIGRHFCYEILNNVDLSPVAILAKYRQEEKEAHEAFENLLDLLINKSGSEDCTPGQLDEIWRWSLEMLDLEHVIETLKLRLWNFIDVGALVREHNHKCLSKGYYDEKKPDLFKAG